MTALWTGIALGIDNFVVALALGALGLPRARRWALALAFGVCEALAVFFGAALGATLDLHGVGAVIAGLSLTAAGALVLAGERAARWLARVRGSRLVIALPACLALDNVVAGAGIEWRAAPVVAVASAAVALAGLELGVRIASLLPRRPLPHRR